VNEPDGPDRFFADYPDGLLVTIVRDPRQWLASYLRHMDDENSDGSVNLWMLSAEASLRAYETRPDRVVVLLFEDLVHKTEAVMRMLCDRMTLEFRAELLEPTFNGMPVPSDSSHKPSLGIDHQVTERHHEALEPEQLEQVTKTAMPKFEEIRDRFRVR